MCGASSRVSSELSPSSGRRMSLPSPAWKTFGSPVKTCLTSSGSARTTQVPFVGDVEREHRAEPASALGEEPLRLPRPDRGLDRAGHAGAGRKPGLRLHASTIRPRLAPSGVTFIAQIGVTSNSLPAMARAAATAGADRAPRPQMGLRPLAADQPRALRQAADDRRPDALHRDPGAADPGALVGQQRLLRRAQRRGGPRRSRAYEARVGRRQPPIPMAEVRGDRDPRAGRADPRPPLRRRRSPRPASRRRCSSTTTAAAG